MRAISLLEQLASSNRPSNNKHSGELLKKPSIAEHFSEERSDLFLNLPLKS